MIALALNIILKLLGVFFPARDARDRERETGENLGQKEAESAGLQKFVKSEEDAKAARDGVDASPDRVWDDPDNRANPASPAGKLQ